MLGVSWGRPLQVQTPDAMRCTLPRWLPVPSGCHFAPSPVLSLTSFAPVCVVALVLCVHVQVVDALSRHFLSFGSDSRSMPLIWHISLLVFVQRYKHQLTSADRDALTHLTTVQHHYKVGGALVSLRVGAAIRPETQIQAPVWQQTYHTHGRLLKCWLFPSY